MIPGDLLSACPNRLFHTLPGLLDSRVALSDFYPNPLRAKEGGSLYHLYDGLWYDPAGRGTHDLPCERHVVLKSLGVVAAAGLAEGRVCRGHTTHISEFFTANGTDFAESAGKKVSVGFYFDFEKWIKISFHN